jgi:precorrin-6A/cobalt-precorrin-6A reductase
MGERKKLLILGGTEGARRLAGRLAEHSGLAVITSLAGRTSRPEAISGALRRGGFGGVVGLQAYLAEEQISLVVDATHPFAEVISQNAAKACAALGLSLLRLTRPPWTPQEGDSWVPVADAPAAAAKLPGLGQRVFLTTGHKDLAAFAKLDETWFLIRLIDPPKDPLPLKRVEVVLARGPFDTASEIALFQEHRIEVLVTKNSGGTATAAKLAAARELALPVVMIQRPALPLDEGAASPEEAEAWVRERLA